MQSFGPLSLTANTLTQVSCSPSAATVYIGNDSPYDVLVSFAVSQPPLVISASGTADWPAVVQAFHHCVLPTPGNISSPQGSTFAGSVWLLPLNTRNVGLALNGTISLTANAWVVACLPGEQPPDAYAAPRQTDVTSQARMIAVPTTPSFSMASLVVISSTSSQSVNYFTTGTIYRSSGGMTPPPGMSHWDGSASLAFYLSYLYVQLAARPPATIPDRVTCVFNIADLDIVSNIVFSQPLLSFELGSQLNRWQFLYNPVIPLGFSYTPLNTVYTTWFSLSISNMSSQPFAIITNFHGIGDNINQVVVPPIGQNGGSFVTSQNVPSIF